MYVGYQSIITVGAASPYVFTTKYLTNNNISYNNTTGVFTIKTPGWYEIEFDTSASATGNIIPTLVINGTASTYALSEVTSSGATDYVNGSFKTVVFVQPVPTSTYSTLQILNNGVAATTITSNIIIKRIG